MLDTHLDVKWMVLLFYDMVATVGPYMFMFGTCKIKITGKSKCIRLIMCYMHLDPSPPSPLYGYKSTLQSLFL